MGLTLTPGTEVIFPGYRGRSVSVTFDSSYVAGGYAITPSKVGLEVVAGAIEKGNNNGAYRCIYNTGTGKLQVYTAGSEVAPGTNLAAFTSSILFVGES